jgi:hypothetical protein
MNTLVLKYDKVVDGRFELRPLNLMLIMQVNCPGSFVYGIPGLHQLMNRFGSELGYSMLSTAFEDAEHNNLESTRQLLEGTMGPAVAEALKPHGYTAYYLPRSLPVLWDRVGKPSEVLDREILIKLAGSENGVEGFDALAAEEQEQLLGQIRSHISENFTWIGQTYLANALKGTPTFVLFNQVMEIKDLWFGQRPFEESEKVIAELLDPGLPQQQPPPS